MTAFPETSPTDPAPATATRLRQRRHRRCTALALAVAAGLAGPASATLVSFDTTTLAGPPVQLARLDFSLLDGDGVLGNNAVTIASITTNGTLGGFVCTVSCSGGPPFTITDAGGLGQFLQDLTLGTTLSFDLSFTTNFSGSGAPDVAPDQLSLLLLDPDTNFTLVDTNLDFPIAPVPVQDALLVVDLAPGAPIQLPTTSNPNIPGTIPEPGVASLLGLGVAVLTGQRIRRRRLCQ